jgi:hypothetical protein
MQLVSGTLVELLGTLVVLAQRWCRNILHQARWAALGVREGFRIRLRRFSLACEFATGVLGLLQIGAASAKLVRKIDGPDVLRTRGLGVGTLLIPADSARMVRETPF